MRPIGKNLAKSRLAAPRCGLALALLAAIASSAPAAGDVDPLAEQARATLATACWKCHGPRQQQANLRLDSLERILAGGDSGPAVLVDSPSESPLIEAIEHAGLEMPPNKKLPDEQVALLRRWVNQGAPWPPHPPDEALIAKALGGVNESDRQFWSFRPLQNPPVPESSFAHPIDAFLDQRRRQAGLPAAEIADRRTLIRRLYFDLIGLPPSADAVEAFVQDESDDAYDRLVDQLLDDPRYGQRWAQHWLDLVRYAESDGYRQDAYRPQIWRYRDYVIAAFNQDKPYAEFITEQLAGDELAIDDPQVLVATGYLRLWPYEYNQRNVRGQWSDILNDLTDVTGEALLGLSIGCARCHDHKFDPISQEEYFRLQAFFTPILPRDDLPLATAQERSDYESQHRSWLEATAAIREKIDELERPFRQAAAQDAIIKFTPDLQELIHADPDSLSPLQRQWRALAYRQVEEAEQNPQGKMPPETLERWKGLQAELAKFADRRPDALPAAMTATDIGLLSPPTVIPGRSEGDDLSPGFPQVLDTGEANHPTETLSSASATTGRRSALAHGLVRGDNPLVWRVIVNRVWQHHFGTGLVSTASDFGKLGQPPSHPELLDWLATTFRDQGGSFKALHRLLVTSHAYRQASAVPASPTALRLDPRNRLLWRQNRRRLDAEQLRDALLAVSGELSPQAGGPSVDPDQLRRSIFTKVVRNRPSPMREAFDGPDTFTSCACRNTTTTAPQSLLLWNGGWVLDRAKALAAPHHELATAEQVRQAYRRALQRLPDDQEFDAGVQFLNEQTELLAQETSAAPFLVSSFPGIEQTGTQFPPTEPSVRLAVAADNLGDDPLASLTIEATVCLKSIDDGAAVRTLIAAWNGDTKQPGWGLGVTGRKSKYQPGSLILQLVGTNSEGERTYEVIPSGLAVRLNQPYCVGLSIRRATTDHTGIGFYLQELSDRPTPLQAVFLPHEVVDGLSDGAPWTIGGRSGKSPHSWEGWIADVRLSAAVIAVDRLFQADADRSLLAHWPLSDRQRLGADESGKGRDLSGALTIEQKQARAQQMALVDLCHVLLNANEFLYID